VGHTLLYLGELEEARRGLSAALSMGEKNGNSFAAMAFRIGLARLHEEALDFDGARALRADIEPRSEGTRSPHA
jgi:hypothetical protein